MQRSLFFIFLFTSPLVIYKILQFSINKFIPRIPFIDKDILEKVIKILLIINKFIMRLIYIGFGIAIVLVSLSFVFGLPFIDYSESIYFYLIFIGFNLLKNSFVIAMAKTFTIALLGWILYLTINKMIKLYLVPSAMLSTRKCNTLQSILNSLNKAITSFIAIIFILESFGYRTSSLVTFFSAFSLAIGFAAQSLIKDFLAGFFFLFEDQYSVGDTVTIKNVTGVVEQVTFRTTSIRTLHGDLHIIPNGLIDVVTTYSKDFNKAITIVSVDYSTDVDFAINILKDEMELAFKSVKDILEVPVVQGVVALNDSSVDIRIATKCSVDSKWSVERELLRLIKNRLDKENIVIPFPQMVIHKQ